MILACGRLKDLSERKEGKIVALGKLRGFGKAAAETAREAAARAKLEADVLAAAHKFDSLWQKLQVTYPTKEEDHQQARELAALKARGVAQKDVGLIREANERIGGLLIKLEREAG